LLTIALGLVNATITPCEYRTKRQPTFKFHHSFPLEAVVNIAIWPAFENAQLYRLYSLSLPQKLAYPLIITA